MTKRQNISKLIKRANERIKWIRNSKKNLYRKESFEAVEQVLEYTGRLNNSNADRIKISGLRYEDEELFENVLENFLNNPVTTLRGQREEIQGKGYKSFTQNFFKVTPSTYEGLVRIFESDTFQKFKENFGTYSNVIDEMAKNPKTYRKAISMIAGVNRATKTESKYVHNGQLDVDAFIKRWREL